MLLIWRLVVKYEGTIMLLTILLSLLYLIIFCTIEVICCVKYIWYYDWSWIYEICLQISVIIFILLYHIVIKQYKNNKFKYFGIMKGCIYTSIIQSIIIYLIMVFLLIIYKQHIRVCEIGILLTKLELTYSGVIAICGVENSRKRT